MRARGMTLVELMVAVGVVGLLGALAVPRYLAMTAAARQSEAKADLRGIYQAERSYFADHNAYSADFIALGYAPQRGNRYAYYLAYPATHLQLRNVAKLPTATTLDAIGVDSWAIASLTVQPSELATDGTLTFTGSTIPNGVVTYASAGTGGAFLARAFGNVMKGTGSTTFDGWFVSSASATVTSGCPASNAKKFAPGVPGNTYDQTACK